jgi:hypothetical protein
MGAIPRVVATPRDGLAGSTETNFNECDEAPGDLG